ncbi:MAG: GAF domain-containing sensor histidine kinase [Sphaerobacter sp.]|nr:GAF domain-containing sensor histidine kinase [Sphaerobacter sp.]
MNGLPRQTWLSIGGSTELRRLKWIAILAPVVFLAALEGLRHLVYPSLFRSWPGYLLLGGVVLIGTLFFAETIFTVIGRMQARLAQQNQELLALHEAGLAITSQLDLETVLQKVVDEARELVGARYGALSLLSEEGSMEAFLSSGLDPEECARLGPVPVEHGMLRSVLTDGEPIRTPDLTKDPRSVGFPPGHPIMHSLLAVPIRSHGRILGSLYLTEKEDAPEFDAADEARLTRFATQAALAIENARLHRRVQALAIAEERERIAREMHDSLAQVLGYVNTKAQAAQELLRAGQDERAAAQIGQLAQAARDAYADVRENILGLRTSLDRERGFLDTLRDYLQRWQDQSGVAVTLAVHPADVTDLQLSPLAELQLLRIIQEALANVRKHAAATQATVVIDGTSRWIEVTIADNGAGFDPATIGRSDFPRFGLATMRERAQSVGGTLDIDAAPGRGTRVIARLPVETVLVGRDGSVLGIVPPAEQDGGAHAGRDR